MSLQNIVLIGFMGTGKSSIGRLLAGKLRYQFLDTDRLIIEHAGMNIPEIFARHGEAHFRDLESALLESLKGKSSRVMATGGGIVVREGNRPLLRELGFVVALTASEEVLFKRVSRNTNRPLLQTENPRETLRTMFAQRRDLYNEVAQVTIDTTDLTQEEVAQSILQHASTVISSKPSL